MVYFEVSKMCVKIVASQYLQREGSLKIQVKDPAVQYYAHNLWDFNPAMFTISPSLLKAVGLRCFNLDGVPAKTLCP